jgi:hypothetical protein
MGSGTLLKGVAGRQQKGGGSSGEDATWCRAVVGHGSDLPRRARATRLYFGQRWLTRGP